MLCDPNRSVELATDVLRRGQGYSRGFRVIPAWRWGTPCHLSRYSVGRWAWRLRRIPHPSPATSLPWLVRSRAVPYNPRLAPQRLSVRRRFRSDPLVEPDSCLSNSSTETRAIDQIAPPLQRSLFCRKCLEGGSAEFAQESPPDPPARAQLKTRRAPPKNQRGPFGQKRAVRSNVSAQQQASTLPAPPGPAATPNPYVAAPESHFARRSYSS